MNIRKSFLASVLAGIAALLFLAIGTLFYQLYTVKRGVVAVQMAQNGYPAGQGKQVIEKVVSKSEVWRPIQQQVKDTVVQVFA